MQQDKLIGELQAGNHRSFERIYVLYSESIYGVIYSITRNTYISEEILQDVFMKIWENASSYEPDKGRFFTWIINIARNASIDKIRSKDFRNNKLNLPSANFVDILESKSNISWKIDAIGLQKYIDLLDPVGRKIIHLLFFQGFTQKETAEEMNIPIGTVKSKNRFYIDKLRSSIMN